jgi:hypothetical protein
LFVFCIKVWIVNGIYPENQHLMLGCEKMQPNLPGLIPKTVQVMSSIFIKNNRV